MLKILTIKESTKKYKNFRYENHAKLKFTFACAIPELRLFFFNTAYHVMFVFSLVEII